MNDTHLELERCSALGYTHALLPNGCSVGDAPELIAGMLGWEPVSVTVNQELSFLVGYEAGEHLRAIWPNLYPQPIERPNHFEPKGTNQ